LWFQYFHGVHVGENLLFEIKLWFQVILKDGHHGSTGTTMAKGGNNTTIEKSNREIPNIINRSKG
jgi:hypothetical protein